MYIYIYNELSALRNTFYPEYIFIYIYIYIVRLAENFILVICLVFLPSLNKTQIKLLDLTF